MQGVEPTAGLVDGLADVISRKALLEQVFVLIWQRAQRFPDSGLSADAWLVTLARSHAVERRRVGLGRKGEFSPDYPPPMVGGAGPAPLRGELAERLGKLEMLRAELILRAWYSGDSYADLAQATGSGQSSIKSWVRRSLTQINGWLGS